MNNIEQLLEAAKILEKRDEGKFTEFYVIFVAHCILTPRLVLFPPKYSQETILYSNQTGKEIYKKITKL